MPVFAHFRQRVGSVAKRLGGSRGYAGSQNLLEDKGNATVLPILGHASPRSPPPEQAEGGRGVQRGSFPGKFQSFTVSVVLNWSKGYKARLRVWMQLWNIMLS